MKDKITDYFAGNYKTFYERYLQNAKSQAGDEIQAICPFHNDHNPSFSFNDQNGKWHCFAGCGGGDIFNFYEKLNAVTFPEALDRIGKDFNILKPANQNHY